MVLAEAVFPELNGADRPEEPEAEIGPCTERGCRSGASIHCAYVDSQGRSCQTIWCPRHSRAAGGGHYCRRHAATMVALGARASDPRTLPPVNHRGASLVSWVFTEGFATLNEAVLSGLLPGELAFDDRSVSVSRAPDGGRRWERGWRIANREGIVCRVALRVEERDDALVSLVLEERVLAQGVPPWISRRRNPGSEAPGHEASERARFYAFLESFVRRGLVRRTVTPSS